MTDVKKQPGWLKRHMRLTLILLYIAVVFAPGIVLGVLALRALDREEAYVEKTLENSLLSEVTQTTAAVRGELDAMQEELREALVIPTAARGYTSSPVKTSSTPLIDTVFILSNRKQLLWPNANAALTEPEKEFLYWNAPLMTDRVKVPVVKNIVMEYQEQIINFPETATTVVKERKEKSGGGNDAPPAAATINDLTLADMSRIDQAKVGEEKPAAQNRRDLTASADQDREAARDTRSRSALTFAPTEPTADVESGGRTAQSQSPQKTAFDEEKQKREAATIFEKSKPLQEEIYKKAEAEGKELLTRNIMPINKSDVDSQNERSLFILSSGTFSDIISAADEGLLPRFLGDHFSLLYWKKNNEGNVIGAVINQDSLRQRILKILPDDSNAARVLVVLDDQGRPIHTPEGLAVDWRSPFVAREIQEALPRWEVAVYLADPGYISSRAEATTSVLWVLTAFLLLAITGGGVILIKMLLSELTLAQKKTNLVTNVSHELKTPLTSIRLFAEMLMADVAPGPAKRREYCALLLSETERLSRLINNVLDFSKMTQGKKHYHKKSLDLVSLCRDVAACERIRLEQSAIRLEFSTNTKKIPFTGCQESLTRVLINLISNAEKYAAAGKRIDIRLERRQADITLRVMDRGPGIPAWAAAKIFNEFFRVDDTLTAATGGSGLGLTITKMIVDDHGGTIAYEPRPGGGSVFRLRFPKER